MSELLPIWEIGSENEEAKIVGYVKKQVAFEQPSLQSSNISNATFSHMQGNKNQSNEQAPGMKKNEIATDEGISKGKSTKSKASRKKSQELGKKSIPVQDLSIPAPLTAFEALETQPEPEAPKEEDEVFLKCQMDGNIGLQDGEGLWILLGLKDSRT
ncbi:hypothetical protein VKT23_020610 [Stygiomarasmius scandens]|uniref:Uncharacterized protein n=1 Tax=Marasmiellus scandens TaxID=2682957 RepID=A0ABR1IMJ5_9AGAR